MSSTLAPIADKLGKLLRLLASDRDGEVVAAAKAIKRTLASADLDIHALADGVETSADKKFSEDDAQEIYRQAFEDGRRKAEQDQPAAFHSVDEPSWHEIACACRDDDNGNLGPRERKFVLDMVRWTVHGGEPTPKQAKWLRSIYARMRR
jgi:hypothetical protein